MSVRVGLGLIETSKSLEEKRKKLNKIDYERMHPIKTGFIKTLKCFGYTLMIAGGILLFSGIIKGIVDDKNKMPEEEQFKSCLIMTSSAGASIVGGGTLAGGFALVENSFRKDQKIILNKKKDEEKK